LDISAPVRSCQLTDDYLYPKDLQKRAIIDQRMHFNSSVVSSTGRALSAPLRKGKTEIPKAWKEPNSWPERT